MEHYPITQADLNVPGFSVTDGEAFVVAKAMNLSIFMSMSNVRLRLMLRVHPEHPEQSRATIERFDGRVWQPDWSMFPGAVPLAEVPLGADGWVDVGVESVRVMLARYRRTLSRI